MSRHLPLLGLSLLLLLQPLAASAQSGVVVVRRAAAPPAGVDCSQWASLEVEYHGDDLGSISSSISAWADQSGNGNDLSQATGGEQPVVAALGTGKGAHFDGSDDELINDSAITLGSPFTLATVVNFDSVIVSSPIYGRAADRERVLYLEDTGDYYARHNTPTQLSTTSASASTDYIIVMGRGSDDAYFIYVDGTSILSGSPSNSGSTAFDLMGNRQGGNEVMDGIIGTTCIWGADHEASEQDIHDELDLAH